MTARRRIYKTLVREYILIKLYLYTRLGHVTRAFFFWSVSHEKRNRHFYIYITMSGCYYVTVLFIVMEKLFKSKLLSRHDRRHVVRTRVFYDEYACVKRDRLLLKGTRGRTVARCDRIVLRRIYGF